MLTELNDVETRILGALMEKEKATPEYYPLTLNALTNACNQKSSREPVMNLDQNTVIRGLYSLKDKNLIWERHEENSRVAKYAHRIENLLSATDQERAILCILMLRGPQTPGEIKNRSERLAEFESPAQVETLLQGLGARADGAIVERMPKQPGQKECRYRQLFLKKHPTPTAPQAPQQPELTLEARLEQLEARVATLEKLVNQQKEASSTPQQEPAA